MRTVALATVILLALTRWTTAEINAADTLEWVSADSDVIVVGSVDTVTRRTGPGSVVWYDTTIRVTETLKGPARKTVRFAMRHLYGETPEAWQTRKAELLLFFVDSQRYVKSDKDHAAAPFALRSGGNAGDGWFDLAKPARAYTSRFTVITKRDELLAATRLAAKSTAKRAHRIDLPSNTDAYKALWSGSSVWLFLPVDSALEQLAIGWSIDPSIERREEAVGALAHFKSAANILRLETLLADPGFAEVTESGKPKVRRYLVRKQAHEVLTRWNVKHTTPVIDTAAP
jgi:hypothetical protein